MHLQPKYSPEAPSSIFSYGTSAREPAAGTIARDHVRPHDLLHTGSINGALADSFPFQITAEDLQRGRERFNIYCSPCHGYSGYGDGIIVQRGFLSPPSYHTDRLRQAPAGHFFNVITNGFGRMYPYADRVSVEDRWRIVAYIRALQLSQQAGPSDLTDSDFNRLEHQP
jgi:mono/diheme cytochrome c family protein